MSFLVLFGHNLLYHFFVGDGNALPWWSQETIDAFTVQAQCFVDQYGNYSVPEIASIVGEENAHVLPFFLLIIVSWVVGFLEPLQNTLHPVLGLCIFLSREKST